MNARMKIHARTCKIGPAQHCRIMRSEFWNFIHLYAHYACNCTKNTSIHYFLNPLGLCSTGTCSKALGVRVCRELEL